MAKFEDAVALTLVWEGGFVQDPADPGGDTNFGIAATDHPGLDIKNLTRDRAVEIYREGYWKPLYSEILAQAIANKLFDMGVNLGVGTAVKLLQRVVFFDGRADGIFGSETLAAVNEDLTGASVLPKYKYALGQHYNDIVKVNPTQIKFLSGWLRRANS